MMHWAIPVVVLFAVLHNPCRDAASSQSHLQAAHANRLPWKGVKHSRVWGINSETVVRPPLLTWARAHVLGWNREGFRTQKCPRAMSPATISS
jgi:hypothetical protein